MEFHWEWIKVRDETGDWEPFTNCALYTDHGELWLYRTDDRGFRDYITIYAPGEWKEVLFGKRMS